MLEAEAMLSGNWKNFDDLEESISYPELLAIVQAIRDREERNRKFQAALKGINLDEQQEEEEDIVEKMKREIRAEQMGMDAEELRFKEKVEDAGFKVEMID